MIKTRSDRRLKHKIIDVLQQDNRLIGTHIDVDIEDGIVILKGEVSSHQQEEAVIHDIFRAVDVVDVFNFLHVLENEDEVLEKLIYQLIAEEDLLKGEDITVHVSEGIVHLYGQVEDELQKSLATQLISTIPKVRDIANDLAIPLQNSELVVRISLFLQEIQSEIDYVHAFVEGYKVILSGKVKSPETRQHIIDFMVSLPGISVVDASELYFN